jgi:DNA-directed RNA polymerase subunit RPC12/RpoP
VSAREFKCPVCYAEFADPDPKEKFEAGIICPECRKRNAGGVVGVIHPRAVKEDVNKLLMDMQSFAAAVAINSHDPDVWHMHAMQAKSIRNRIHSYRTGEIVADDG